MQRIKCKWFHESQSGDRYDFVKSLRSVRTLSILEDKTKKRKTTKSAIKNRLKKSKGSRVRSTKSLENVLGKLSKSELKNLAELYTSGS